jgi:hypothetical protein
VRYPVRGLDLAPYLLGPADGSTLYDLFAVTVRGLRLRK